jgi:hypothetical protein
MLDYVNFNRYLDAIEVVNGVLARVVNKWFQKFFVSDGQMSGAMPVVSEGISAETATRDGFPFESICIFELKSIRIETVGKHRWTFFGN